LLLVLFLTSCNWSDRCFFDFHSNWFQPRPSSSFTEQQCNSPTFNETQISAADVAADMLNTTANALVGAAADQILRARAEWTGLGLEWLRSLLGRREWRIDCLDIYIRL
jgi:hypothetical protein